MLNLMKIILHKIGTTLGPLTSTVIDRACWAGEDEFPSSQLWADEIEKVLNFAEVQGQFKRYLSDLTASTSQRDSAIAELRVAFFFHRNQFDIVRWKPDGLHPKEGEFLVRGPLRVDTFVEVKSPGWEGQLSGAELKAGRPKQPKYLNGDFRSVASWERIQFAVDKAYEKFSPDKPNLLVVVDDLFVHLKCIHARQALCGTYEADGTTYKAGCFSSSKYHSLGGVGIFLVKNNSKEISYEMKLFLNPYAHIALPDDLRQTFHGLVLTWENC